MQGYPNIHPLVFSIFKPVAQYSISSRERIVRRVWFTIARFHHQIIEIFLPAMKRKVHSKMSKDGAEVFSRND